MKFTKNILGLFYLILLFSNCVEEFNPEAQGYENLLVVDAFLSDSDESFTVTLSRSFPIDTTQFIPESGAFVSLSSESGETHNLQETGSPGNYQTNGNIMTQVGQSYKLSIQTQNGNQYESSEVTMRKTPEIDSITFRYEEKTTAGLQGMQVYANTHDPANNTWYYRWEWDESWEFSMPYDSYLYWEDDMIILRDERIYRCWKYDSSTSIDISSSKSLTEDRISDFPLIYVTTQTDRLERKYSLLVKQYGLSEESYNYWKELQNVTENLGTLFDPQPSIIYGNIININDPNEIVLGYFDASTVSEQRIFISRKQLPPGTRIPNFFSHCIDSIVSGGEIPAMVEDRWQLVTETINEAGFPAYLMSTVPCIDCRLFGSNIKPDYWD